MFHAGTHAKVGFGIQSYQEARAVRFGAHDLVHGTALNAPPACR